MKLINEMQINTCYVNAIEYGEEASTELVKFLEKYKNCVFVWGESEYFGECNISKIYGNCIDLQIFKKEY